MNTLKSTQKHDRFSDRIKEIQCRRNLLVSLCKKTSEEFGVSPHWLMKAVFTRNYSLNYLGKWWLSVSNMLLKKWNHQEMYELAAQKLTPDELRVLKISRSYKE
jgi:hypothetical protein